MNVVTTNPIVYDSSVIDEDYMNATGRRNTPKRRRTGFNKAIGFIPAVAVARAIQNRRDENRASARTSGSSKRPSKSGQSRPLRPAPRPSRTNPLQGKPNMQQPIAPSNAPEPTPSNNKKLALIIGAVLLVGFAVYFYSKRKK